MAAQTGSTYISGTYIDSVEIPTATVFELVVIKNPRFAVGFSTLSIIVPEI